MGLELIREADLILDDCGRPTPPPGYKVVPLPRAIAIRLIVNFAPDPISWGAEAAAFMQITPNPNSGTFSVEVLNTGAPGTPFSITVLGTAITVQLEIDGGGSPVTTGNSFVTLWAASAAAAFGTAEVVADGGLAPAGLALTTVTGGGAASVSGRVENKSNTLFVVKGVCVTPGNALELVPSFRIRWPSGRYFQQQPSGSPGLAQGAGAVFPGSRGANMFTLNATEDIPKGARIFVEAMNPPNGTVIITFWGELRYLVVDRGKLGDGAVSCIIGYPEGSVPDARSRLVRTVDDPIVALQRRPRYACGPNGNIMAPEWMLGNQCLAEVDDGRDEGAFNFASGSIDVGLNDASVGNAVIVPGSDDVFIRRMRPISTWPEGAAGTVAVSLRLPNGYSVTGGDYVPFETQQWLYFFPRLRVRAGDRLILDVTNKDATGAGGDQISTVFEFEGVKDRAA